MLTGSPDFEAMCTCASARGSGRVAAGKPSPRSVNCLLLFQVINTELMTGSPLVITGCKKSVSNSLINSGTQKLFTPHALLNSTHRQLQRSSPRDMYWRFLFLTLLPSSLSHPSFHIPAPSPHPPMRRKPIFLIFPLLWLLHFNLYHISSGLSKSTTAISWHLCARAACLRPEVWEERTT
jgi:hypothetical protein